MSGSNRVPGLGRAVAVLAVVALAAMVVSPAFSAFNPTKAKIKQIAKKQATKVVKANTLDQGTIPPVTASVTDQDKTVYAKGPFRVRLDCSDDGGNVNLKLIITTTEANSVVDAGDNNDGDFDPSDGDVVIQDFTGNAPGGDATIIGGSSYYDQASLRSPSGTEVYLQFSSITNYLGSHCFVDGFFFDLQ